MKMYEKQGCKVIYYKRKNNSYDGNPKYYVIFETMDGEEIAGITATNAACGYSVSNYFSGKRLANIKYHITKKGNVIFDYILNYKE